MEKKENLKSTFINMLEDIKNFKSTTSHTFFFNCIITFLENVDCDKLYNIIKKQYIDGIFNDLKSENFTETIFKLLKEIQIAELENNLIFLKNLTDEEIEKIIDHVKIIKAYIEFIK